MHFAGLSAKEAVPAAAFLMFKLIELDCWGFMRHVQPPDAIFLLASEAKHCRPIIDPIGDFPDSQLDPAQLGPTCRNMS